MKIQILLSHPYSKVWGRIIFAKIMEKFTAVSYTHLSEGRVDCGFLRLPTRSEFDALYLESDRLLAVLPENHELSRNKNVPVSALCKEPFMLLEKGAKAEVSEIFENNDLTPSVHFTTWDDYAIKMCIRDSISEAC